MIFAKSSRKAAFLYPTPAELADSTDEPIGCEKARAMGRHGAKPHTPSLGMGKCKNKVLPGAHNPCEHVITGKRIAGGAGGADRLHRPTIRVCPPQERVRG